MTDKKTYIGDSVYVDVCHICGPSNGVMLMLDNGYGPHTVIALEPDVLTSMLVFLKNNEVNVQWP